MVTRVNITNSTVHPSYEYLGLSTDQKPSDAPANSLFRELDTGDCLYFSNGQWNQTVGDDGSFGSGGGISVPYTTYSTTEINGHPSITQVSFHNFTVLPMAMFQDRPLLETVDFSGSPQLTLIDAYAFYGCTKLALTEFPTSVQRVSEFAFRGCTALTDLSFHSQMQNVDNNAFYGCTDLKTVRFLGTPTLAQSIFGGCTKLTDIYVPWSQGAVAGAPWGAPNATIHYDWKG